MLFTKVIFLKRAYTLILILLHHISSMQPKLVAVNHHHRLVSHHKNINPVMACVLSFRSVMFVKERVHKPGSGLPLFPKKTPNLIGLFFSAVQPDAVIWMAIISPVAHFHGWRIIFVRYKKLMALSPYRFRSSATMFNQCL